MGADDSGSLSNGNLTWLWRTLIVLSWGLAVYIFQDARATLKEQIAELGGRIVAVERGAAARETRITTLEANRTNDKDQLDRIERKLDRLIEEQRRGGR